MGGPIGTRWVVVALLAAAMLGIGQNAWAEAFVVKNGKPHAEIVVSKKPARMAKLAAEELQTYIEKISGARLPITAEPGKGVPVQIFVGRSAHTDRLGVTDEGLQHGAFRMVSGEDWLVLLGDDTDFVPREPYGHSRGDIPRVVKDWDALTGEKWGNPCRTVFKLYNKELDIWETDGRGSINAVYQFLRGLGVRWYLPGELGEILPSMKTIAVPKMDKVVRPDFAVRDLYQYYKQFFMGSREEVLWQLRLGLTHGHEVMGYSRGHGTTPVHSREEVKKAHPEYFALWGGKRAFRHHGGGGAPCLSSEGLFRQNVKYVRALYNIYDEPMVSVAPADGYVRLCQCELCRGKGTPERGWNGQLSDYVWGYVNRVAKELYKTHPNRKVSCIAYTSYLLPPEKIEKLSPNIVIILCRWRSNFYDPETRQRFLNLRKAWLEKLPSKEMYIWDYYLHSRPGRTWEGVPVYFPRIIAEDLRSLKGLSKGEHIEIYRWHRAHGRRFHALAANHLNLYVTTRLYWDADQDLAALLDEYYDKFYGPARGEMKKFVEYAEANWMKATKDKAVIDRLFQLLGAARTAAGDSVYGKRIDLLVQYMEPLKQLREKLAKGRKDVPRARAYPRNKADIKLDGKLDEEFWQGMAVYSLRELQTGRQPAFGTSFRVACAGDSLFFGIICRDLETKKLNIAATRDGDANVWAGDAIELLLETQTHSYYQIAISPAGAVVDLDRKRGLDSLWSSGAEVASHVGQGFWSLEVRIPIAGPSQEQVDPRNGVSGRKPSETYPWYFNLCRQRVRDTGTEHSAFSPTGKAGFHDVMKFGKLYMR